MFRRIATPALALLVGLSSGCLLAPGSGDSPAVAAVEVEAPDAAGPVHLTGPAYIRRTAPSRFLVAARFVRPSDRGMRRGDLILRVSLPGRDADLSYRGFPATFTATYLESSPGQVAPDVFDGSGSVRVDFRGALSIAFELELRRQRALAGEAPIRLRGFISERHYVVLYGYDDLYDLGLGVWIVPFDPILVYEDPDVDFGDFIDEAGYYDYSWATEPVYGYDDTYGYFDYGYDGYSDYGGSDWGGGDYGGGDWGGDSGDSGDW
jgi:hypothetical protein